VRLDKDEPLYESLIREVSSAEATWSENAEKGMYFTCRICALSMCQSVFLMARRFFKVLCAFAIYYNSWNSHTKGYMQI